MTWLGKKSRNLGLAPTRIRTLLIRRKTSKKVSFQLLILLMLEIVQSINLANLQVQVLMSSPLGNLLFRQQCNPLTLNHRLKEEWKNSFYKTLLVHKTITCSTTRELHFTSFLVGLQTIFWFSKGQFRSNKRKIVWIHHRTVSCHQK